MVGEYGSLVLVVSKYEPQVICGNDWNAEGHLTLCRESLGLVPVTTNPMVFGTAGR